MNYKNNTPFKLKGSPFKQTTKNVVTNSAGELLLKSSTTSSTPDSTRKEDIMGYSGGGTFENKKEKDWYDDQINKRVNSGMSKEDAIQDYRNTFSIGEKKVVGQKDVVTPGVEKTKDSYEPIMYTPQGSDEESWEQRSNIRANKNITSQIKRNDMRNLREGNIKATASDYAPYGTDGSEEYSSEKMISKKATRQAIKDARKEKRNLGPTTDPAYAKANAQKTLDEAKGRHKKMKKIYKDKKREIKGKRRSNRNEFLQQELRNRLNMSKSGNNSKYDMDPREVTSATNTSTTKERIENAKGFQMSGFGSKNKQTKK